MSVWRRLKKLADRPFASALGLLLLSSMVVTLSGLSLTADVLEELVPEWLLVTLSVTYGLGGVFLLLGIMFDRGDSEASGCVLIVSGLMVRALSLLIVLGFSPAAVSTVLFYVVFGGACVERFLQILRGDRIIRVHHQVKLEFKEGA